MARSLDQNIYGTDDNDFAGGIADDALSAKGKEDIWGATFDQEARAKGNVTSGDGENPEAKSIKYTGSQSPKKSEGN